MNRTVFFLPDIFVLILVAVFLPTMSQRLQTPNGLNALLLVLVYGALCIGIHQVRRLHSQTGEITPAFLQNRTIMAVLGGLFGMGMMTMLAQQLGYFDTMYVNPMTLGEGQAAVFFVLAPSAWLMLSMFYVLVLAFTVEPRIAPDEDGYYARALFCLFAINGMLFLGVAQLHSLFGGGWMAGLVTAVTLLLLFLPPRLVCHSRLPKTPPLSLFAGLVVIVTGLVVFL